MQNNWTIDQKSAHLLGVFGGSFDPPHLAHVMLAAYVLAAYPLDRLLVAPTFRHPLGKQLTDYEHRVKMCELALADLARVEISRIEQEMGGTA